MQPRLLTLSAVHGCVCGCVCPLNLGLGALRLLKEYTPLWVGLKKVQSQVSAHVGRAVALVLLKPQRSLSDALEGRLVHQIRLCNHRLLLHLSGSCSSLG